MAAEELSLPLNLPSRIRLSHVYKGAPDVHPLSDFNGPKTISIPPEKDYTGRVISPKARGIRYWRKNRIRERWGKMGRGAKRDTCHYRKNC